MLETAAWADHEGGESDVGRGYMRRCRALYANAEVDEAVDSALWSCRGRIDAEVRGMADRIGSDMRAFREAMVE